jgi:hypothetical protein
MYGRLVEFGSPTELANAAYGPPSHVGFQNFFNDIGINQEVFNRQLEPTIRERQLISLRETFPGRYGPSEPFARGEKASTPRSVGGYNKKSAYIQYNNSGYKNREAVNVVARRSPEKLNILEKPLKPLISDYRIRLPRENLIKTVRDIVRSGLF